MVGARRRARAQHRHALAAVGRGDAARRAARRTRAGIPVVLDPVGAGATRYRTDTAKRILDEVDVTVLRGNAGEVATLVGVAGRGARRRVDRRSGRAGRARARRPARSSVSSRPSPGRSTTSPTASASLAVANGHALLAAVTGTGCMSSAITGCFLAAKPDEPLEAAAEALAAFGVAAEDAAAGRTGPGSFHAALYDALAALDPDDARRARAGST